MDCCQLATCLSISLPPSIKSDKSVLCLSLSLKSINIKKKKFLKWRGVWVAQLVERPTSTQVMILQFVSSRPASGSVLTARRLEPASHSVSPSLSAPSPLECTRTCSLSLKNKH